MSACHVSNDHPQIEQHEESVDVVKERLDVVLIQLILCDQELLLIFHSKTSIRLKDEITSESNEILYNYNCVISGELPTFTFKAQFSLFNSRWWAKT